MRTRRIIVLAALTSAVAATALGCSDGDAVKPPTANTGSGGTGLTPVGGNVGEVGGNTTGPAVDPNAIGGSSVTDPNAVPNTTDPDGGSAVEPTTLPDGGPLSASDEFEGIDYTSIPMVPVVGCEHGLDMSTGTLTLTLGGEVHSLVLDAAVHTIRANGIMCTAADGTPATPANVQQIIVQGSPEDDTVVFDLLPGDFGSSILTKSDSVKFNLAAGNDVLAIRGTRGDDSLRCVGGTDGINSVDLGSGVPSLSVRDTESMLISLGPGSDSFTGTLGTACSIPLVVYGGNGGDTLAGGAAADVLNGGEDSDTFDMGPSSNGGDIVNGGPGEDYVSYAKRLKAVTINLCPSDTQVGCPPASCSCGADSGEKGEGDTIVNVESAEGGDGDDTIVGDLNANALVGGPGDDDIDGRGGDDEVYGDDGSDKLRGGEGDDILIGGPGRDTLDGQVGDNICLYDAIDVNVVRCQTRVLTSQ